MCGFFTVAFEIERGGGRGLPLSSWKCEDSREICQWGRNGACEMRYATVSGEEEEMLELHIA